MSKKPNGYWTYEKCKEVSLICKTKQELRKNYSTAYNIIYKNKWTSEFCSHMILSANKPNNYWTKERCQEEALKYTTKKEFIIGSYSPYTLAVKHKWIDDICSHMIPLGNKFKRCIYAWEFEDNSVYIGLTMSLKNRITSHINNEKSQVYKHLKICNKVEIKQISDYIDIQNAIELEKEYILKYKNDNWTILNK